MSSNGIVAAGFGGPSIRTNSLSSILQAEFSLLGSAATLGSNHATKVGYSPLAFLEPDGAMYHLDFEGTLIPYVEDSHANPPDGDEGREMGTMASTFLSSAQDYVARARYLVGNQLQDPMQMDLPCQQWTSSRDSKSRTGNNGVEAGNPKDDDPDRKIQAEVLLKAYSRIWNVADSPLAPKAC
ncbi:hypothetical protein BDZ97DRAFT_13768 [Flammula alnicola]|nr:hypothetical protein BDZ97DRAFT_13768 [Flammula alnicola]